jgi:hypothetical protein
MKKLIASYLTLACCCICFSQTSKQFYPEPEFLKEVYALNTQSSSLTRLEKETSRLDTKTKLGGFGGSEYAYTIPGETSKIHFSSSQLPSFIYQSRKSNSSLAINNDSLNNPTQDLQLTNAMDVQYIDPSSTISLYALYAMKGERKLLVQASGGAFGKGKKASSKHTISFKKIKDGYYEISVDKQLPKGEYAFMTSTMGTLDATFFMFRVE